MLVFLRRESAGLWGRPVNLLELQNAPQQPPLIHSVFNSPLISIIHHTTAQHFETPDCASSATEKSTVALETSLNCLAAVAGVRNGSTSSREPNHKIPNILHILGSTLDLLADTKNDNSRSLSSAALLSLNLLSSIENHSNSLGIPDDRKVLDKLFAVPNCPLFIEHIYNLQDKTSNKNHSGSPFKLPFIIKDSPSMSHCLSPPGAPPLSSSVSTASPPPALRSSDASSSAWVPSSPVSPISPSPAPSRAWLGVMGGLFLMGALVQWRLLEVIRKKIDQLMQLDTEWRIEEEAETYRQVTRPPDAPASWTSPLASTTKSITTNTMASGMTGQESPRMYGQDSQRTAHDSRTTTELCRQCCCMAICATCPRPASRILVSSYSLQPP
ncbi:hypothetical protein VP01_4836g1, partial [Puccinia sorghi]